MSELHRRLCQCGNTAAEGRPTCGIVLCLTNDAYERAVLENARQPSPPRANSLNKARAL